MGTTVSRLEIMDNAHVDPLTTMRVFVRVAHRSRFAAAARDLRMSPAAVTKHVAALEERIGARLFDRTTRHVALTEAGRVYLDECLRCLQSFEDADASVKQLAAKPRGLLRVTAPLDLQHRLPIAVARLIAAHPLLTVELSFSNRTVDLVEERIDVAVRMGSPQLEGDFVARPLAPVDVLALAAPAYLDARGRPRRPQELAKHPALVFVEPRPRLAWTFERDRERVEVVLQPAIASNNGTALLVAAAEGAGVVMVPSFVAESFIEAGQLEVLLPAWRVAPPLRLYAAYPHKRFVSPSVTIFVEMLRDVFGDRRT